MMDVITVSRGKPGCRWKGLFYIGDEGEKERGGGRGRREILR